MAACSNAGQSSMGRMFCIKSVSISSSSCASILISVAVMDRGKPALAFFVLFFRVLCVKSLMLRSGLLYYRCSLRPGVLCFVSA